MGIKLTHSHCAPQLDVWPVSSVVAWARDCVSVLRSMCVPEPGADGWANE